MNLAVNVDGEDLTPWSEMVAVPYAFRAEYVNRFPAPVWDSGWITQTPGYSTYTHNVGGDTDNYIVDMQFKDAQSANYGVNNRGVGLDYVWLGSANDQDGGFWNELTNTQIEVYIGGDGGNEDAFRIRIWRTE